MDDTKRAANSGEPLDSLDRKILSLLQTDGRLPNAEIARSTGVSVPTVRKRIERMQESGVLQIVGVLEPAATGYPVYVIVGVKVVAGEVRDVGRALAAMDRVCWVAYSTGRYNLLIEAVFRTGDDLLEFLSGPLGAGDSIVTTEVFTILGTEKFAYMWEIPDEPQTERER